MKTVVEPQQHIAALWSKPEIRDGETFRLMRYVMRVDQEDKVLLHNVVTGQLVLLDQEETDILDGLPKQYCTGMEHLIDGHYLVAENYDEHLQVRTMRSILRMLAEFQATSDITSYTILTTTACNARCYYCFERGARIVTMSEQTARDVVEFITAHCGSGKKVSITWFGGEPTLTPDRIGQICAGLSENGIEFSSKITTNGYLFDESIISQASTLWHLESVNISLDGTEERYNIIKSYINPVDNPYQRVMRNIGLLLKGGIRVNLRMNFGKGNYFDFKDLVQDVIERFGKTPLLKLSAHQINSDDADRDGSEEWFSEKIVELNDLARKAGLYRQSERLPSLVSIGCKAAMDSTVTITPEGNLVRCPEHFEDDQITGNVRDGITNGDIVASWKELVEYDNCIDCFLYPHCLKMLNCSVGDRCCYRKEYRYLYQETIKHHAINSLNEN